MFKNLWKKLKKSVGKSSSTKKGKQLESRLEKPDIVEVVKPPKPAAPTAASPDDMAASTVTLKATKPAGGCPSYAAKSVVGQRPNMEDSWQAVPDLFVVPEWWTCNARDHLPPAVPRAGETVTDPAQTQQQGHSERADPGSTGQIVQSKEVTTATGAAVDQASCTHGTDRPSASPALDPKQLALQHGVDPVAVHFFAVYDGHGGPDVAKHCAKSLHEHLKTVVTVSLEADSVCLQRPVSTPPALAQTAPDGTTSAGDEAATSGVDTPAPEPTRVDGIEAALQAAFLLTDAQLAQSRSAHEMGTTAVVSLVTSRTLWVGNCGDSRALLCRQLESVALSLDHKATRADEVARVEKAGGYVWWDRVMGELAVSRAIGDHCLRPYVIAEPEITSVMRRSEDQLLIMASDGLWDVFTNEDARALALEKFHGELARTASSKMAVKKAASCLAKEALRKGSRDNVTVIVVDVRLHSSHRSAARATAINALNVATAQQSAAAGQGNVIMPASETLPVVAPARAVTRDLSPTQAPASPVTPGGSDAGD